MGTSAARKLDPPASDPGERTPESFLEEMERIFNSGTLRGAREVAEQGLTLYPDHPELRQAHHALRPFEVRINPHYKIADPSASYAWIKRHSGEYRGKWVALANGELVASSDHFAEIVEAVRDRDSKEILLHHILA
ncbi:MAG TPA: DUF5678 domain-containing protein [Thermoanaerobaculia bacterium]|jgi:hypothetical protein|nr:DUF5678 domain-containing protein [Thermoanaerobaculia bacterium]